MRGARSMGFMPCPRRAPRSRSRHGHEAGTVTKPARSRSRHGHEAGTVTKPQSRSVGTPQDGRAGRAGDALTTWSKSRCASIHASRERCSCAASRSTSAEASMALRAPRVPPRARERRRGGASRSALAESSPPRGAGVLGTRCECVGHTRVVLHDPHPPDAHKRLAPHARARVLLLPLLSGKWLQRQAAPSASGHRARGRRGEGRGTHAPAFRSRGSTPRAPFFAA